VALFIKHGENMFQEENLGWINHTKETFFIEENTYSLRPGLKNLRVFLSCQFDQRYILKNIINFFKSSCY
jgi:hypothetical protein